MTRVHRNPQNDAEAGSWRQPLVYDILSPDGRLVGRVELPFGVEPRAARGRVLWALARGELGEPQLVKFRLGPAG